MPSICLRKEPLATPDTPLQIFEKLRNLFNHDSPVFIICLLQDVPNMSLNWVVVILRGVVYR